MNSTELQRGTVRWFSDAHGYGFISDADGKDVFAHYSVIQMDGFKSIQEGDEVDFQPAEGPKGTYAAVVVPVTPPERKPRTFPPRHDHEMRQDQERRHAV